MPLFELGYVNYRYKTKLERAISHFMMDIGGRNVAGMAKITGGLPLEEMKGRTIELPKDVQLHDALIEIGMIAGTSVWRLTGDWRQQFDALQDAVDKGIDDEICYPLTMSFQKVTAICPYI